MVVSSTVKLLVMISFNLSSQITNSLVRKLSRIVLQVTRVYNYETQVFSPIAKVVGNFVK